ncbi:MAG: hypothetical protein AABW87_03500, partial [Nanoarchaeota archaeon]
MKKISQQHRKAEKELIRQAGLCKKYTKELREKSLKIQERYDKKLDRCYAKIDSCIKRLKKDEKKSLVLPHTFMLVFALITIAGIFFFTSPQLTGFSVYETSEEGVTKYEDGYNIEGPRWAAIRGLNMHERCLKVRSNIEFDSAEITGKIMSAANDENLVF